MFHPRSLVLLLVALLASPLFAAPVAKPVVAYPNLKFERPLYFADVPDGSGRVVVLEQAGKVWVFDNRENISPSERTLALDISGEKVSRQGNEEGLLGLAFHPDFKENRQVFLHYSVKDPRRGILSRWTMNDDGTFERDSEEVLLQVDQPWGNHNGGMIEFGEDGYLYLALGDGGAGGDPKNNGQDLSTLLGTILRIDVDQPSDDRAYGIPEDNPFVDDADAQPEIYAYGLRNVWRFSFDRKDRGGTGYLWAGDVGQNKREEIDIILKGRNYGWNFREGFIPFDRKQEGTPPDKMMDPIVDHGRDEAISITGGYVYRGKQLPLLQGAYVYGDYGRGNVWLLRFDGQVRQNTIFAKVPELASFGLDADGELYACSFDGHIYKFVSAG